MSHSNLELMPVKSINKSENSTLHTFTVYKCHIKLVAYERRNKLTMHRRIESNRIELGLF